MMSHAMATSQPPPSAKPLTAAMTGLDMCAMASQSPGDGRGRRGRGRGGGGGGGGGKVTWNIIKHSNQSRTRDVEGSKLNTAQLFSLESTGCFGCMQFFMQTLTQKFSRVA